MKIQGYHGTHSFAKASIARYGFDPDKTCRRQDHWLGQGVYFFTDQRQALWWANSVSGKRPGSYPVVYRVEIEAPDEKVLDLDDNVQLALYYDRILDGFFPDAGRGQVPLFTRDSMRAVFPDYYKKEYGISVITRTFAKDSVLYAGKPQYGERLKMQRALVKMSGLSFHEKQICVSEKSCIKCPEIIYDGEYEVI